MVCLEGALATVRHLSRREKGLAQAVLSRIGETLTRTGNIVGRWKEHIERLLDPSKVFAV